MSVEQIANKAGFKVSARTALEPDETLKFIEDYLNKCKNSKTRFIGRTVEGQLGAAGIQHYNELLKKYGMAIIESSRVFNQSDENLILNMNRNLDLTLSLVAFEDDAISCAIVSKNGYACEQFFNALKKDFALREYVVESLNNYQKRYY
jgi:hypothetical protein